MPVTQARLTVAALVLALSACAEDPVTPDPPPILTIGLDAAEVRVSPTRTATLRAIASSSVAETPVTMTLSGLPAGVTATLSDPVSEGLLSVADLQLRADVTATPGLYVISVTASSEGASDVTSTFKLRVADLVTVSIGECTAVNSPHWFAVQDGNGALREMEPHDGEYRFAPEEDHAGFWYVVAESDSFTTRGVLRTTSELLAAPIHLCEPARPPAIPVTGVMSGLSGLEIVYVTLGGPVDTARGNGPFTVRSGPGTTHDLIATKLGFLPSVPNRILLRRDVDITTTALGSVDLNAGGPEVMGPASALMTYAGPPREYTTLDMRFHSGAACTGVPLYNVTVSDNSSAHRRVWGIPTDHLRATDWHRLTVGGGYPDLSVTLWSHEIAPFEITRRAEPPYPTVERLGGRIGLSFALEIPADYDREVVLTYATWRSAAQHAVRVEASRAWMLAEGDRFTSPDFAATPGWITAWNPDFTTDDVYWTTRVVGGPGGAPCTAGVHEWAAEYWGTSWP